MKNLISFKILAAALVVAAGAWAQGSVWNGTTDTRWYNLSQTYFTINTAEQLAGLAELVNGGNDMNGKTFTLGANIMLNDTTNWQNWATTAPANSWTAIGNNANRFKGTFDGAGYVVGGVYINNSNYYQGVFGFAYGATIKNLGVVASYVKGGFYVGGLVGLNYEGATITNCYATGNVSGGYSVGGLTGGSRGTITNCYATGNVSATGTNSNVGGLAGGCTAGTITNCYATGNVSATGTNSNVGGLVGYKYSGSTINSYYDKQTSGQNDEGKGTPKSTVQMKTQAAFVDWDFGTIWRIDENINDGYPHHDIIVVGVVTGISGITNSATYNETVTLNAAVEPSDAANKTISWSVIGDGAVINGNSITFTKAGKVTIRATIENGRGRENYTKDFVINVAKANPIYTIPTNLTATVGQTIANVSLPAGWSWMDETVSVGTVGNQTHKAKYTPSDINNYNILTDIDVTVTVSAGTSISDVKKSGNGLGIIFEKNVVSDELKIVKIALPDGKDGKLTKVVIYDNTGNVVFSGEGAKSWNLRNKSGRIVANGSYLVIVEAKSANGKTYWYSAKIVVKK